MNLPDPQMQALAQRVVLQWTPACWFGFVLEAFGASTFESASERIVRPAHFLVAAWAPVDAPPLPRLPHAAAIASPNLAHAAVELLRFVPRNAPLLMIERHAVDAGSVADMILEADRNLDEWIREALERFVEADRARVRAEIASDYTDRDDHFERFKRVMYGSEPGSN